MKIANNNARTIWIIAAVQVVGAAIAWSFKQGGASNAAAGPEPQLPFAAMAGKKAYAANCVQCHGTNGAGTNKGPPLVHEVYNPGHHSDASFARVVDQGVRQHHGRFGDMPAQPEVTDAQRQAIVRYVQAVQESGGITLQPPNMQGRIRE